MNKLSKTAKVALLSAAIFIAFAVFAGIVGLASGGFKGLWVNTEIRTGRDARTESDRSIEQRESIPMDGVNKIHIQSVSSRINIKSGGDEIVGELIGHYTSLNGEINLKTEMKGDTLIIKTEYTPKANIINIIPYTNLELNVIIPEEYMNSLTADTVSDRINMKNLPNSFNRVNIETTSGKIEVINLNAESLTLHTVSGSILADGISSPVKIDTVSGRSTVIMNDMYDIDMETVSGRCELTVPSDSSFYINYSTVSGGFKSDFDITVKDLNNRKSFNGKVGDGGSNVNIETVSGSFNIFAE